MPFSISASNWDVDRRVSGSSEMAGMAGKDNAMTYRSKKSVYQIVTDRIVSNVEGSPLTWFKAWHPAVTGDGHVETPMYNYFTGYCYNLMNCLMLRHAGGYATLKQLKDHGAHLVGKDGNPIEWPDGNKWPKTAWDEHMIEIVAQYFRYKDVDDDGNVITDDDGNVKTHAAMSYYYVVSVSHTDLPEKARKKTVKHFATSMTTDEQAEAVVKGYYKQADAPKLFFGGNSAYYSPMKDEVHVPAREQFGKRMAEYYSTVFHETGHSTGNEARLNRNIKNTFGSDGYAREELVAELTAAMVCAACGIETDESMRNSTAYLQSWKAAAEKDPHLLERACSMAEKAFCYIMARVPEYKIDADETVTKPEETKKPEEVKKPKRTRKPRAKKPEPKPEPVAVPVVVEPKPEPKDPVIAFYEQYRDAFDDAGDLHIEGTTPEGSHVWFKLHIGGLMDLNMADFKKAWKTLSPYMTDIQKEAMKVYAKLVDQPKKLEVMNPATKNKKYAAAVRLMVKSDSSDSRLKELVAVRDGDTLYTSDCHAAICSSIDDYATLRSIYPEFPETIEDGSRVNLQLHQKSVSVKKSDSWAKMFGECFEKHDWLKSERLTKEDIDFYEKRDCFEVGGKKYGINSGYKKLIESFGTAGFTNSEHCNGAPIYKAGNHAWGAFCLPIIVR